MKGHTSLDELVRSLKITSDSTPPSSAPTPAPPAVADEEKSGHIYECKPGPWGCVRYYYIYLEAPAALVARFPMPNSVTKWSFPGWTHEQLHALFEKAGLPQQFQEKLLAAGHVMCEEGVATVFPALDDLEAMTPEQRSTIYEQLAQYDENEFYKDPVIITCSDVEEWLKGASIRPALIEKLRKYVYKRHEAFAVSDLSAMLNYMQSDQEARDFQKLMTRTRTLIARLKVNEGEDLHSLAEYWGGGPGMRNKDIQPMLQSVAATEGVPSLDITHLLPSLARKHIYSYPTVDMALLGRIPDCHWTSLNFFNYNPKDYYLNTRLAADQVLENYQKVSEPYRFGDVLMFMDDRNGTAVHSCVYVADDIVYTKNGDNLVTPWVLMKLDEVKKIYFFREQGSLQAYRFKVAQNEQ